MTDAMKSRAVITVLACGVVLIAAEIVLNAPHNTLDLLTLVLALLLLSAALGAFLSANAAQSSIGRLPTTCEVVMSNAEKHLALLGLRVRDRVSGIDGVVTSVCFDLYGCIQAAVHRGLDKDGRLHDMQWYDIARLLPLTTVPVMEQPNFVSGQVAEGGKGPAERPNFFKP